MEWRRNRVIGDTGLSAVGYSFGTTAIGGRHVYAEVGERDAIEAVHAAYEEGIRLFDTAPFYGLGVSEVRLGEAMVGLPREDLVISSKVGRFLRPATRSAVADPQAPIEAFFDYSYDSVLAQVEESLERLQTDRLDIVFIHDPEWEPERLDTVKDEAYPALARLKEAGDIGAIGIGLGDNEIAVDLVEACDLDIVMIACRYTLADQSAADRLLPLCRHRGISVFLAAPFNSGLLATGTRADVLRYNHHPATAEAIEKVRRLEAVCDRFGVPLRAAALQFPLRSDAISTVVTGARTASEVRDNIHMLDFEIPEAFWSLLQDEGLVSEPTLAASASSKGNQQ
jgi:D-threo-aldose 1-dehydrogenase